MLTLNTLTQDLNCYLNIDQFKDYCPNGLQVTGASEIQKIVTGVTACEALIDAAINVNAQAIIVHHGYFWKNEDPCLVGIKAKRIKKLFEHNISLLAYHLPLDAHPQLGNNQQLAKRLQIEVLGEIPSSIGKDIVLYGKLANPIKSCALVTAIHHQLKRAPLHFKSTKDTIQTVAWCTGAGQDFLELAASAGVDAFITGEVSERTFHVARELNIDFFAAGHHATERYGIAALGEYVATKWQLPVQFIDIDNPV